MGLFSYPDPGRTDVCFSPISWLRLAGSESLSTPFSLGQAHRALSCRFWTMTFRLALEWTVKLSCRFFSFPTEWRCSHPLRPGQRASHPHLAQDFSVSCRAFHYFSAFGRSNNSRGSQSPCFPCLLSPAFVGHLSFYNLWLRFDGIRPPPSLSFVIRLHCSGACFPKPGAFNFSCPEGN